MFATRLLVAFVAISSAFAHPVHQREQREIRIIGRTQSATIPAKRAEAPELNVLFEGNKKYRETVEAENPGLLKKLSDDGQGWWSYLSYQAWLMIL